MPEEALLPRSGASPRLSVWGVRVGVAVVVVVVVVVVVCGGAMRGGRAVEWEASTRAGQAWPITVFQIYLAGGR